MRLIEPRLVTRRGKPLEIYIYEDEGMQLSGMESSVIMYRVVSELSSQATKKASLMADKQKPEGIMKEFVAASDVEVARLVRSPRGVVVVAVESLKLL